MHSEVNSILKRGYAEKICFEDEDYEELESWIRKYFGDAETSVIEKEKYASLHHNNMEFNQAIGVAFSEYQLPAGKNDAFKKILHKIISSPNYREELSANIDKLLQVDEKIYYCALISAMKYIPWNDNIFLTISKCLYEGKLETNEKTRAEAEIIKYGLGKKILIGAPMKSKKIAANYYFSKHYGAKDIAYCQSFLNSFKKIYNIDLQEDTSNIDIIVDVVKNKLQNKGDLQSDKVDELSGFLVLILDANELIKFIEDLSDDSVKKSLNSQLRNFGTAGPNR